MQKSSREELYPSTVRDGVTPEVHAAPRATLQQLFARHDERGAAHTHTAGAAASAIGEQVTEAASTDRQPSGQPETPAVQMRPSEGAHDVAEVHAAAARVQQIPIPIPAKNSVDDLASKLGEGAPLGGHEAALAQRVGADPAAVRVHRGTEADQAAAERQATAFTVGNHVVMGSRAPAAGTAQSDEVMLHEAAHVAQQQDAARDPAQRAKPIGSEDQAAERAADHAANPGLAPTSSVGRTGLQLQRLPWDLPQQTPKDVGTRSIADKAAFIKRSMAEADEGWSRVVVDVFEQTDPAARITLQRQLDMERIGRSSSSTTASAMLWCSRSPPRRDFSGKDSGCVAMCTMVPAMLRWR